MLRKACFCTYFRSAVRSITDAQTVYGLQIGKHAQSCKKTAAHVPRKIYKTLMTFTHVHARPILLWAWLTMAMLRWVSVHSARPHIETQWRRCAGAQRSSCCTAEHEWQTAVLQRMMQSASFGSLCMCAASISIFRWMDWCFLACGNAKPCSL